MAQPRPGALALTLATAGFALSFLIWGLIGALAPLLERQYGLTSIQVSLLIAAPVLLGSLGRIPAGLLTDRWGGRRVFAVLLAALAIPLALAGSVQGYAGMFAAAVLLGLAGCSFAVGVPFVSQWYPGHRQGLALGIYGAGNAGTAFAALLAPWLAARWGISWAFWAWIPATLAMAAIFFRYGQEAPAARPGARAGWRTLRDTRAVLLSLCYFVTFGGFVAFGGYLPKLYVDLYGLPRLSAGTATAAFVLLATACRPLGGWLADRLGGRATLAGALATVAAAALLLSLALPRGSFQLVSLALAVGFGLGNGAVFKLVPQLFPGQTGAITGLVGAVGGLGGFFPPLLMGMLRDRLGTYTPGFGLLSAAAAGVWLLVPALAPAPAPWRLPAGDQAAAAIERLYRRRAGLAGAATVAVLLLAIYAGSSRLAHFDPALYGYAVATVVSALGLTLRLSAWLMRPATHRLLKRLVQLALRRSGGPAANPTAHPGTARPATAGGDPGLGDGRDPAPAPAPATEHGRPSPARPAPAGLRVALTTLWNNMLLNRFILRRGLWRGLQHLLIMWGVLGSFAITVPLVFGWLHFAAVDEAHYQVVALGLPLFTMPVHGWLSGLFYHGLSVFAVLTLVGVGMALIRRFRPGDARVDQRVEYDLLPLYLLLAVTVTGLALTASHSWLEGAGYPALAVIHQITVVALLLYLPFGKLWHIPLRLGSIATEVYHQVGAPLGEQACARCGKAYATRMQIQDVTAVMAETGLRLLAPDGRHAVHDYCQECRRVLRGLLYARRADAATHPEATAARIR